MTEFEACRQCHRKLPPNHPIYFCDHSCEVAHVLENKNKPNDLKRLTDALLEAFPEERPNVHPVTGEGTVDVVIRLLRYCSKLRG